MEILTLKTKLDYERKEHGIYPLMQNNGKNKNRKNLMMLNDTILQRLLGCKLKPQTILSQSMKSRHLATRELIS
jgi:hypothetical protein